MIAAALAGCVFASCSSSEQRNPESGEAVYEEVQLPETSDSEAGHVLSVYVNDEADDEVTISLTFSAMGNDSISDAQLRREVLEAVMESYPQKLTHDVEKEFVDNGVISCSLSEFARWIQALGSVVACYPGSRLSDDVYNAGGIAIMASAKVHYVPMNEIFEILKAEGFTKFRLMTSLRPEES